MRETFPFVNLKAQYLAYQSELDAKISEVLSSSAFIIGEEVRLCEQSLAVFSGTRYAKTTSSGTTALLLALLALGIKPNDEVITSPFSFIAAAEMIAFIGAKPVFVDIDERTYHIDVHKIESAITPKTKAILPVSLFGMPCDMDSINSIASNYALPVIEDAAQSFGATYKQKRSCHLSTIGVTSFFPSKPLGCYGDGGAVFCDDEEIDHQITLLRHHGQSERYTHQIIGMNARLDSLQCAILNVKLQHFAEEIRLREEKARFYNENLQGVILPYIPKDRSSVYAQYSIRACNSSHSRQKIIESLHQKGVPIAVHYPLPLHLQECFAFLGYKKGDFPVSERVAEEIFSLPFSAFITQEEQIKVIESLNALMI
uniref:Aminotransferase n=1 Tax=uncultured Helicobacter sp. TaxID=175537 RepID=A0A650EL39_9HELI|nr:aminotransferase [uncultured Helicobacter sp.]